MWTAIVLGASLAAGVAVYLTFAAHALADGAPLWALAAGIALAYLAVPLFFSLFWFVLAWWFRAERPEGMRLAGSARLILFGGEFVALARSVPRMILYRLLMQEPAPMPAALPVLLLHGVGCNAGVWTGMRRHLEARGLGPVYALSYGPPLAPIGHFADQVAVKIAAIAAATGAAQVVLIGHSMGGLVARDYLRRHSGAAVRRLVTIGTPHHGSMHAWLMTGHALAQMRPANAWLAELNAGARASTSVPMVSIWSWHDSMVTPQTSSRIASGENVILTGVAHNALLDHREVWARVVEEIEAARRDDPPAMPPVQTERPASYQ
jgi:triacylglycerol esterase/lipase EstA (alpha/beta hydrolase family)